MTAATKKRAPRAKTAEITPAVTTYLLRTCAADLTSYGGFQWPASGPVECPDWNKRAECGHGLHGLLMGAGSGSLLSWAEDAKWLVVAVDAACVVAIDNQKVKVPRGDVVYCGAREGAIALLIEKGADPSALVCGQASASGYAGQASASGTRGQASASGYAGQASASGDAGQASASGDAGQASASGYAGQASASGYAGQASASGDGRAMAGMLGLIMISRWDGVRTRIVIGYVDEDGIEANTWYRLDSAGAFILAPDKAYEPFTARDCAADARKLGEVAQ